MKAFRKILFWTHLVAGVVGGIVIFIMCVTGAALSFEKNITEMAERDQRYVAVGDHRLSTREILLKIIVAQPNAKPSSMAALSDPTASLTVALGREGQLFVDPYAGVVTGEGNKSVRGFFRTMNDLHRYIALSGDGRPAGKAITGVCNLLFLFLAISGLYIWMPRKLAWSRLRTVMWFRKTHSGKARDFNWHNTIGFWSSLVLIVLTLTATVISYQWAGNLIYTLTGNDAPQQQQPPAAAPRPDQVFAVPENIDAMWYIAEARTDGWKSIALRLPVTKDAVFTIDEGRSTNIFGRSTLTIDAATGIVSKWEPYAELSSAKQIRSWFRFTHTGESFGMVGQIVGFIACISGAFLVITGLSLALRRQNKWLRRNTQLTPTAHALRSDQR
ncbi:MAG: PepSY-associated TM helix domain-containing protein [Acidobacteriota bacterium]